MSHFSSELFQFLRQLKRNNNRDWFAKNKERYLIEVREPALQFVTDAATGLRKISANLVADPRPVGGSMFRINRDTRFSTDKAPYKTAVGLRFPHRSARDIYAPGLYLHLEPDNVFIGVGIRQLDPKTANRIREAIVDRSAAWTSTRVGPWPGRAGRAANRIAWRGARVGTAVLFDRPINRHRRRLGLPRVRAALLELPQQAEATIVMASRHVIEPPLDWPGSVTVTSFVAWDGAAERPLDDTTRAFLDAGTAPVLVTLGSNGAIQPDDFFDQAARLVLDQGLRALVVTGPGGRPGGVVGLDDVHVTEYVAFGEVMDRCRGAVHHAGVGTTVPPSAPAYPRWSSPKASTNPTPQRASKL